MTSTGVHKVNVTRLVTVAQLAKMNSAFTVGMLRWLIHKTRCNHMDDTDGFAACLVRPQRRRLLIDLDAFEAWLERRRQQSLAPAV